MDILVSDIMKKQVISVDSSLTVKDAAKMMDEKGVSCLIVTEKNMPVGILTERDFVTRIVGHKNLPSTPIHAVMSKPLIAVSPDDTVKKLADLMHEKKIHKMPVVKNKQLLGIVTTTDLVKKCIIDSGLEMRQLCNSFVQMAF
jgi:CBS domain-containing protein